MADFVNFKIKSVQSFRYVYRDRVYVCMSIEINVNRCMSIYIYF
jgi:hypothetical protein